MAATGTSGAWPLIDDGCKQCCTVPAIYLVVIACSGLYYRFSMLLKQQDERKDLCYVHNVTKETPFWTVIVQLVRKEDVKIGKSGKVYQGYVFSDMHGTFVGAVSYEQTSKRLGRVLRPYCRYYISNAPLKPCTPGFNVSEYPYSWTLTNRIPVHPIHDSVPYAIPHNFNFKKLSDIHKFIDHDEYFGLVFADEL